ncbi:TolC family protein [Pedobacter sp. BS3]|uniref:TolC family protein n=1 Tax=Pedobacter sp. BS3 TaxID=2567937 RepID=UPI0011ED3DC7|nr:TolC family protein [Pedobacter sp. BS3]TZF83609.1 TolC family protein [Pedobacter sp. BS3]
MKRLFLIAYSLLLPGISLYAQQPDTSRTHTFNLQQCIDYAYEHQVDMKNAALDIKKAEYKVKETIGIGLPQISGKADFQDYVKSPTILFPDFISQAIYGVIKNEDIRDANGQPITMPSNLGGTQEVSFQQKYNSSLGLNVTQLLFDGSYLVGLQASKTYKELSSRSYARTRVETNAAVSKAYYQVLVSDQQIRLFDANIKTLKQQLDETTALNKQGFAEKVDVDRLTVQYNNLITNRDNAIRSMALGYQMLKFQMGMPVSDMLIIPEKIEDIKLDEGELAATTDTTAYRNRIEYQLLETQLKLNQLDLKRYKSQYLPSLAAFGSSSLMYQENSFKKLYDTSYPTTVVGLQLNVPIFSGLQRLNQVRQAKVEVEKSKNTLLNAKNGINLEVEQARINFRNNINSLNNQKKNMDLANEVLRVSKIKYQQGVGSSVEVTQAQTSLETAEVNYIEALYNALVSKVDLNKAYGNIK